MRTRSRHNPVVGVADDPIGGPATFAVHLTPIRCGVGIPFRAEMLNFRPSATPEFIRCCNDRWNSRSITDPNPTQHNRSRSEPRNDVITVRADVWLVDCQPRPGRSAPPGRRGKGPAGIPERCWNCPTINPSSNECRCATIIPPASRHTTGVTRRAWSLCRTWSSWPGGADRSRNRSKPRRVGLVWISIKSGPRRRGTAGPSWRWRSLLSPPPNRVWALLLG